MDKGVYGSETMSTVISVIVPTYNQRGFLRQALDGVLAQTGPFSLEVVVGDDASSDGTRAIVDDYAARVPEVVRALEPAPRLGISRNLERCLRPAHGDYIAVCEGDDYWTSPDKLAKQMEFLRDHEDCAMCFNAIVLRDEEKGTEYAHPSQLGFRDGATFDTDALIADNFIGNFSCCFYRARVVRQLPDGMFGLTMADWLFNIVCSEHGRIGFLETPMSVYRIHAGGAWTGKSPAEKAQMMMECIESYDGFLGHRYHAQFERLRGVFERLHGNVTRGGNDRLLHGAGSEGRGPLAHPLSTAHASHQSGGGMSAMSREAPAGRDSGASVGIAEAREDLASGCRLCDEVDELQRNDERPSSEPRS